MQETDEHEDIFPETIAEARSKIVAQLEKRGETSLIESARAIPEIDIRVGMKRIADGLLDAA